MSKLKLLTGSPNEIVWEREFDAPRRLVIKAMTTPDLVKRWLGGVRAEMASVEIDLRVGGRYRYVFRQPNGHQFSFGGVHREISDDRIVYTQAMDDDPDEAVVTTTWTEANNKTTMRVSIVFASQAVRDMVFGTGMATGAGESYDKLEELVASL
jgi:uncharacterized protein YndB with AHSA1/START domain